MHKWVVGATAETVQCEEERPPKKKNKRERALAAVVVILLGVLAAVGWHAISKTSKDKCDSPECIEQAAWILSSMEPQVDPCDNFYCFVCNLDMWNSDSLLFRRVQQPTDFNFLKSSSNVLISKAKDVYYACMNTEDARMYLDEFFETLNGWGLLEFDSENFDWRLFLYKARKHGLKHNMLFDLNVYHDSTGPILRIEPPSLSEASDVIEIFNMTFGNESRHLHEVLKQMATLKEGLVLDITIEELENRFSVPSFETLRYITGYNFSKGDKVQLAEPKYFEQLKELLYNKQLILQDYLMYELVRPLIKEYDAAFHTWPYRNLCISKANQIVPFMTEFEHMEEIKEMADIAKNIIEEHSSTLNDNKGMDVITVLEVADDFENFVTFKSYVESEEKNNYMQLLIDAQKYKQDCYYSALNEANNDLSCVLYNANNIKIHYDTIVIPAKSLEHSFFYEDGPVYLNYASIGSLIGRELVRAFITFSSNILVETTINCLLSQQADFYYIPSGIPELEGEDMFVDLIGTKLAYMAYSKKHLLHKTLPGLDYDEKQLFWLAKFRQDCVHSEAFSQISVLPFVNFQNFTKDFSCYEGSYMNPTSVPRCSLL